MEEGSEFRRWDELIPDAQGLIFKHLPFQEILTVIPVVCKAWRKTVMGSYCWQEIEIEDWSRFCRPESRERMLHMLIGRSGGSLRKLCVSDLHTEHSLSFIADHAKCLQTLWLPRCDLNNSIVEHVAHRLSSITSLNLSYCYKIGGGALAAVGTHCRSLRVLRRNMHPFIKQESPEEEAVAVATTMPRLTHLELAHHLMSTDAALRILGSCRELELLDLRGCWNVLLDGAAARRFQGVKVMGPSAFDPYDPGSWANCSDYSTSSGYVAWDFMAGESDEFDYELSDNDDWDDPQSMEDVELRFYDGFDVGNDVFDWPQSP